MTPNLGVHVPVPPRPAGTADGWYRPVGAVVHLLATAAYCLLLA
ncbi:hypothetical protein [Streptomyces sirii]